MNKGKGNGQQMKPEGYSVQKPNLHVPEPVDASALLDQLFLKENLDWNAKSNSQDNSKSFKTIRKDNGNSYYFELPFDIPQRPRTRSYYSKVIGPPQNPETLIMPAAGTEENLDWNAKSNSQDNSKSFKTIRKDNGNSYYFELPFDIPQRPRTRSYYSKVIGPPQNPETLIMPAAGTDENSYDCGAPDELQCKEVTIPNTKDNHEEVDMDLDESTFVKPPQPENDNNLLNARIALIHEEFLRGLIK